MQIHSIKNIRFRRVFVRIGIPLILLIAFCIWQRQVVMSTLGIVFGAAIIGFLVEPVARLYEKKLSRNLAALFALLSVLGAMVLALLFLLPDLIQEIIALSQSLPESIEIVKGFFANITTWLEGHMPGIQLPMPSLNDLQIPVIAAGTLNVAGNIASVFYKLSLMIVLSYFFLCDRTKMMIRLELVIPMPLRKTAVQMGKAVCRELKLYLRGQGMIAIAVGTLSAIGLAIVGVRSAIVLGVTVGILNMIPYFGPWIGAVPAVVVALGSGWMTALLTILVMVIVQQIDGMFISPRIMGNLTGVSPATVLIVLFAGSLLSGILGMLLALPVLMTIRTVFRVYVQRHETIEI